MGAPKKETPKKESTTKSVKISPQEEQVLKAQRAKQKAEKDCVAEVQAILEKYGAKLAVNRNSPIGNPSVIISI